MKTRGASLFNLVAGLGFLGLSLALFAAGFSPALEVAAAEPATTVVSTPPALTSAATGVIESVAPEAPASAPLASTTPVPLAAAPSDGEYFDVDMALRVLFEPDSGHTISGSVRWAKSQVSYSVALDGFPPSYIAEVDNAFAWASTHTGLTFVRTDGPADIVIDSKSKGDGGLVRVVVGPGGGPIRGAHITLGCCRVRTVYEEILQALGPLGDHADSRSVFAQDRTATAPSDFDAWVLSALYSLPPASSRSDMAAALTSSR